jgi:hypothetical protein
MTQDNLGNVFAIQASETSGDQGEKLITDAVNCFKTALSVYTPAEFPQQRAVVQKKLDYLLNVLCEDFNECSEQKSVWGLFMAHVIIPDCSI